MNTNDNITTWGDYIEDVVSDIECSLTFSFRASHFEKAKLWQSKDLSAEFFGNIWNNLIELEGIKPTLHFICAELLENAVYHSSTAEYKVVIHICLKPGELLVYVTNHANTAYLEELKTFIGLLITTDNIQELFIERLKESKETGEKKSQLGLITIIKDRGAKLGWKLCEEGAITKVTTLARIPLAKRIHQ